MPPKTPKHLPPEWSFLIEAEKIGPTPAHYSIHPNAEERKKLAQRLGVRALDSLNAEIDFVREPGKATIHATGDFEAEVKQDCVVSGKPVNSVIRERFEAWFADREKTVSFVRARQDKLVEKGNQEMPILEESEDPEPIVEGQIDAGELVTQYLSLAINPYPHAEGVAYEGGEEAEKPSGRIDNPFAALKNWKDRREKE